MGTSGPIMLGIAAVGLVATLVVAYRTRLLDWLTRRIEGRQPPEPSPRYGQPNCRVVRNGPPRWQRLPCDMDGWDDPRGAA